MSTYKVVFFVGDVKTLVIVSCNIHCTLANAVEGRGEVMGDL